MEQVKDLQILETIDRIYEEAKDCRLSQSFFDKTKDDLKSLSEYLNVTPNQALLTALVFAMGVKSSVDLNSLIYYLDCSPVEILKYIHELDSLFELGILARERLRRYNKIGDKYSDMILSKEVSEAILSGCPHLEIKKEIFTDVIDLLDKIYQLAQQRNNDEISSRELFIQTETFLSQCHQFPLIRWIGEMNLPKEDTFFFIYVIWNTLTGNDTTDMSRVTEKMFDNSAEQVRYVQQLISRQSPLTEGKLIEIEQGFFFNEGFAKLTMQTIEKFREFGLKFIRDKQKNSSILIPEKITHKELIFNQDNQNQLSVIKNLLTDENIHQLEERLVLRKLPKGITVMLYGTSGTGKTEFALQIAKETNRNIMKVDIANSKSKWFGESEKLISRFFSEYRTYSLECCRTPILLFNEADGIISMRKNVNSSSVAQTENAIQNILLEELENFEGILIATTNLVDNIDPAFERRFLFKMEFCLPDARTRSMIWGSKLPHLSQNQLEYLATHYDFTGGQIENVARKYEIESLLNGETSNIDKIIRYCDAETFSQRIQPIGFLKN
jgi:AAA+ superfamily predicted ATPase